MKMLNKSMLSVLLSLSLATGYAQSDSRPQRFAANPQTVSLDRSLISNMLKYADGTDVIIPLAAGFNFDGTVIGRQQSDNIQTVIIRSADNAIFQVSEVTRNDKSIVYTGRILSQSHSDGYIIKNNNGEYFLTKIETAKILQHCN